MLLFVLLYLSLTLGLPRWHSGKETASNAVDAKDTGLIPGLGRSTGVGNGNPLQYSCLENSMDRESWQATLHGVSKGQTQLSTHTAALTLNKLFGLCLNY